MARPARLTARQLRNRKIARLWAWVFLSSALACYPLWKVAVAAGYGASSLNYAFELIATAALADTVLCVFALLAWWEFDSLARRPY